MTRQIVIVVLVALVILAVVMLMGRTEPETPGALVENPEGFPVSVVDGVGREVEVESEPHRLVSLAPNITETLFALGLEDRIVGVTDYCDYPAEVLDMPVTKVGGFADPSVEVIASLEPDLVLATDMHTPQVSQLENLGIPTVVLTSLDVDDVLEKIELIGVVTGCKEASQALRHNMTQRIDAVLNVLGGLEADDKPLVYYEVFSDPLMSAGPKTLIHELIEKAGGINLARDADTDYPQFSAEAIIQRNPDVIVYPAYHGTDVVSKDDLRARAGWSTISAIVNDRCYSIDGNIISRPGPRIVEALEILAKMFHPEFF